MGKDKLEVEGIEIEVVGNESRIFGKNHSHQGQKRKRRMKSPEDSDYEFTKDLKCSVGRDEETALID